MKKVRGVMQRAKSFFRRKRTHNFMKRKLNKLKMDRIGPCDSNFAKRILKKQTVIDTNPDRVRITLSSEIVRRSQNWKKIPTVF